jgi:ATP-dependent exoDNAse (exonuclease V) beta subunit (contains helicase and exonuclease domains)
MIRSVVEAIYDDYAKVNFTNYELRREDLDQLALFARRFKDVHEFLSQLALISNVDAEAAPNQTSDKEAVKSFHGAPGQRSRVSHGVRDLVDRRNVSEQPLARHARCAREERRCFIVPSRAHAMSFISRCRTCG